MDPIKAVDLERLMKINSKLITREMQLRLVWDILGNGQLNSSSILPSVSPKIGRKFAYRDLELKKEAILQETRLRILRECAVVEANRDIIQLSKGTRNILNKFPQNNGVLKQLERNAEMVRSKIRKNHQKKIQFFLGTLSTSNTTQQENLKRAKLRSINREKKKKKRKKYLQKRRNRQKEWLEEKIKKIASSVVRNLSSIEIPDTAFLYLAKGLNFVESKKASKADLLYDTQEFLRKLEWKAFFHENPQEDHFEDDEHRDLRIPSRKHPEGYQNAILDDIKMKLKGFVANFIPENPKANLTAAEQRGKSWIKKEIEKENIFITKADKGGATLILDYKVALRCVNKALDNKENFTVSQLSETEKMLEVQRTIRQEVLVLTTSGEISERDKTLITGLNENNNLKHAHCFKPVVPYVYPLFKIHKLNQEQITNKVTPPIRLVHATKEGPLYRLEKWVSPYLTEVSRKFCEEEFILDSPALINVIKGLNYSGILTRTRGGENIRLFTLDVINLYPSIDPAFALKSLKEALGSCTLDTRKCATVQTFTEIIFKNAFVCFQGKVFTGNKGIPTGNCVSRQMADITLHVLLFTIAKPQLRTLWKNIAVWKRYIDDVFGVWTGSERQFHIFVKTLNQLTKPYGIQFGDFLFGKEVNYLDMKIYLDELNSIEYRLFKKETDARLFLQTESFHPKHVFKSVAFSQMIRVIQRNSQDHTSVEDLCELKNDLTRCGHAEETLEDIEPLAVQRVIENEIYEHLGHPPKKTSGKLIYSVKFFKEVDQLKALVGFLKDDIRQLCGDVRVTFALRRNTAISSTVIRNRHLSESSSSSEDSLGPKTQRCEAKGCLTCPLLFDPTDVIIVNGQIVNLDFRLNCKDRSIIYLAQCQICTTGNSILKEDSYFGQTVTPMHIRMNGHRDKFIIDERLKFEQSALSMHCFLKHKNDFKMGIFKLGIVRKMAPLDLDREEEKFIFTFRTKILGLNRIVVTR